MTSASKKSNKELPKDETKENVEMTTHKKRYIPPEERHQIIDELRLVPKKRCILLNIINELGLTLKKNCMPLKKAANY